MISLDEYQDFVESVWNPSNDSVTEELRAITGLFGEAGEVAELIKKWHRGDSIPTDTFRTNMEKELGDTLYYLAKLANFYDMSLEDIMKANVDKLISRRDRGVLLGSGDDR